MNNKQFHHFLIGLPASGKSTFAQQLAEIEGSRYEIISTDRIREQLFGDEIVQGDWRQVEAEVMSRIKKAIASGKYIIYDATNLKRSWRMDWLEKVAAATGEEFACVAWYLSTPVETCKKWNLSRQRQVPEIVIEKMSSSIAAFPPDVAEGFVAVHQINPAQEKAIGELIREKIKSIPRSITNRKSRTAKYTRHRYSRLRDFERLMHLIALMIEYPGLGNLQTTAPQILENIFRTVPNFATAIEEISAIVSKRRGPVYANPQELAIDLEWLERNGIVGTREVDAEIEVESDRESGLNYPCHRYSDLEPFGRLMKTIRYIAHHPFKHRKQEEFIKELVGSKVLPVEEQDNFRRDVQEALKPYRIISDFPMKRGYFVGTGIFTKWELEKLYGLIQSQKMHLQDPVAVDMLQKLRERIEASKLLEVEAAYPIRVIGNRGIVNPEKLPERALSKQLETLEKAILAGELLELARIPKTSRFSGQIEGSFPAYPIQIVFHNIGWYLGYEVTTVEKAGLLEFERLDKLCLLSKKSKMRSPVEQKQALDRLTALYTACPGIFLGKSAEDQRKYLDPKRRKSVEMEVELWMGDQIFQFFIEGNQRFAKKQMKMSKRPHEATQERDPLYTLEKSGDREFPNRFQVKLPKWSIADVDLKRWIIGFGGKVKVVQPEELVEMIKREGEGIISNYQ